MQASGARVAEQIATETVVKSQKEDGSIDLNVKIRGMMMEFNGDRGSFKFSTRNGGNKYARAFQPLVNHPFQATIASDGSVSSVRNLRNILQKVRSRLPSGTYVSYLKNSVLRPGYFKGIVSLGWMNVQPDDLDKGDELTDAPAISVLPGANASTARLQYTYHKDTRESFLIACKAGIGRATPQGIGRLELASDNRKVIKFKLRAKDESPMPSSGKTRSRSLKLSFLREEASSGGF